MTGGAKSDERLVRQHDAAPPTIAEQIRAVLDREGFSPQELIDVLKRNERLEYLFTQNSEVGYTVEEHTALVIQQFQKYFANQALPGGVSRDLMFLTLALHDIGKPIAKAQARQEHECTIEFLDGIREELGIDSADYRVMRALIDGDPIGQLIQTNIGSDAAADHIVIRARQAGMRISDFFKLTLIFFQCDAGSYTVDAGTRRHLDHLFEEAPDVGEPLNSRFVRDSESGLIRFAEETWAVIRILQSKLFEHS